MTWFEPGHIQDVMNSSLLLRDLLLEERALNQHLPETLLESMNYSNSELLRWIAAASSVTTATSWFPTRHGFETVFNQFLPPPPQSH